jgi:hypothetical protein
MQAGLLRSAGPAGSDLLIMMLDGNLGAVTPAEGVSNDPIPVCFCDCTICGSGQGPVTA